MKNILLALLVIIAIDFLTISCANPKTPTGGEKDTIPPALISSNPSDQSLNFKDKTIKLSFDEYINADKLQRNLIITPITDISYKTIVKKNTLTLILDEALTDSTTYTLNFFDGITDITERTPASNLIIAISTGPYIDSLQISGETYDIQDKTSLKEITIGLYSITDTLDFETVKPTYFIKSDEEGQFSINNIKAGPYKLLAFDDANGDLLFDPAGEKHGFLKDTLNLSESNHDSLSIPIVQLDVSRFELKSARPSTHYFHLKYSKPIVSYRLTSEQHSEVYSQLIEENQTIRVYPLGFIEDSTSVIAHSYDTLNNLSIDTINVKLRPSSKKLEELTIVSTPKSNTAFDESIQLSQQFNKPILRIIDSSFLYYHLDTIIQYQLPLNNLKFNEQKTRLTYTTNITQQSISDTLQTYLNQHPIDTMNIDSTQLSINRWVTNQLESSNIYIKIKSRAFVTVENDTSSEISNTYKFPEPTDYGTIKLTLTDTLPSFMVQLMSSDQVIKVQNDCTDCLFTQLPPATYWVRVLIDTNSDGYWSPGNLNKDITPEPIRYFTEETVLRANWEVELNYSLDNTNIK